MSKRQLVCKSRRGLMAVRCRRHPRNFKSLFGGGRRPPRSIRPNFRRLNIEVIAFNCRHSSSAIVSERETASERKNPNGNGVAAKSAFAAWTRGGIRLHAIVGAGAVGGRSTGGRSGHSGPPPRPGHTGCNGDQHDAPLAISDGTRAAPVNLLRPPHQLQHNRGSVCFQTPDRAIRRTWNCISVRRTTQCARPQMKRKGGDESTPLPQNTRESIS